MKQLEGLFFIVLNLGIKKIVLFAPTLFDQYIIEPFDSKNNNEQIIKTNKIKIGKNITIKIISNNLFINFKGSEHFFQIII